MISQEIITLQTWYQIYNLILLLYLIILLYSSFYCVTSDIRLKRASNPNSCSLLLIPLAIFI